MIAMLSIGWNGKERFLAIDVPSGLSLFNDAQIIAIRSKKTRPFSVVRFAPPHRPERTPAHRLFMSQTAADRGRDYRKLLDFSRRCYYNPASIYTLNLCNDYCDNAMIPLPAFFLKPPSLKQLPLKPYRIHLSLDRLMVGVDNIHIDVHISPRVHGAVKQAAAASLIRHSRSEHYLEDGKKEHRGNEKLALKQVCADVLREAIYRTKSESEAQIDLLGQVALAKMVLEEIKAEYRKLITKLEILVRSYDLSRNYDQSEWLKMKEKLTEVKQNRKRIVQSAGEELFHVLTDVHRDLKNIREANFPADHILPDDFFNNPTLHVDDAADEFLLVDSYVLLSQRSDEPDNYNHLKSIIDDLLDKTDMGGVRSAGTDPEGREAKGMDGEPTDGNPLDLWLMELGNIDLMFNWFDTRNRYRQEIRNKAPKQALLELKSGLKIQRRLLNLFHRKFKRSRLMMPITASYETKPLYRKYCPPLRPAQIREYLLKPRSRKAILRELQSRRPASGDAVSPLQETVDRMRSHSARTEKERLLTFLKDFLRYHRDLEKGRHLKQAMDTIHLIHDEKTLLLSKKNRLLYEFPLPEEKVKEQKPIIGHVILKADIRGSIDITHTMAKRGLNPASYFSLNFFDPISEILGDYHASKVFIEGDAIILSVFENEDTEQDWYSVARSCGLAVKILHIVRCYNEQNQMHDLPILELGIGICYKPSAPAFLFDGDSRIMISQAINLADRLSSCDKNLRKRFRNQESIFNLFVFQHVQDDALATTADDISLRYNVNGIELDPESFSKLSREISLKRIEYRQARETVTLYTGKVPTVSGSYQRLVIREADIPAVKPETMEVTGPTSRKYYEVCTNPAIYEFVDTHT